MARSAKDPRTGSALPGSAELADDVGELLQRLVALRRRRGLSQTEVAARMGTSQSALARLEAGRSDARLSTLARYAAALDTRVAFALSPEEGRPSPGRPADEVTVRPLT